MLELKLFMYYLFKIMIFYSLLLYVLNQIENDLVNFLYKWFRKLKLKNILNNKYNDILWEQK